MARNKKEIGALSQPQNIYVNHNIGFDDIYNYLPATNHKLFLKSYAALSEVGI